MKALFALVFLMALGSWTRADQVRVFVQWIELQHPYLTNIISPTDTTGSQPHATAMSLVKQGKAKILDTNIIVIDNVTATLNSVAELIFPTEYDPPEIQSSSGESSLLVWDFTQRINRICTAFETRDTGSILQISPTVRPENRTVLIKLTQDHVFLQRLNTLHPYSDTWGDASLRMPIFEAWKVNTQLILTHGRYELAGVIRPETQPPAPAVENRILVFVRADLLSVGTVP